MNRLTEFLNVDNIIIENVNDLISIINEKKEIEYVNYHPHFTLLGYKKDELIGTNFLNYVHIDNVEFLNEAIEKGFKLGDVTQKIRLKRKIGDFIWIELKGKLIKDDNEIKKLLLISKKIDVRNKTGEDLSTQKEKFRLLYENAPLGYQSLDKNGYILDVNRAWLELLGYTKKEVMGKWFGEFLVPKSREKFKIRFPVFKEQGGVQGVEFEMVKKDGPHLLYQSMEELHMMMKKMSIEHIVLCMTSPIAKRQRKKSNKLIWNSSKYLIFQFLYV